MFGNEAFEAIYAAYLEKQGLNSQEELDFIDQIIDQCEAEDEYFEFNKQYFRKGFEAGMRFVYSMQR